MPAKNLTITALWTAKEYTVTFDATGGDVTPTSKDVTYDSPYGDLPTASRTGYGFDGWFTEANGGGDRVESTTKVEITDDQTLYANWTAGAITVTFNATGGISTQTSRAVTFDSTYGELQIATKTGYTFSGWFTEEVYGTEITKDTKVTNTNDHSLYAHWTINQYTISFDANGGSDCLSIKQDYNSDVMLPDISKIGYTFAYWCSDPELRIKYEATTMPAENKTLYAKWTINQYTITFDFGNGTVRSVVLDYKDSIPYPNNLPSKSFQKFVRWCAKG